MKSMKYFFGNFPDNRMDTVPLLDLCKFIEANAFGDSKPDLIFTHHPNCLNIDHSTVYRATITAFRPQCQDRTTIYSYSVPSSTDYSSSGLASNVYWTLTEEDLNAKIKALEEYDEEMRTYPHTRSYENVRNLAKVHGSEIGNLLAEKFVLVRMIN